MQKVKKLYKECFRITIAMTTAEIGGNNNFKENIEERGVRRDKGKGLTYNKIRENG